ncbi:MAG: Maf family protein [Acidobacteriota bacterium]
MTEVILASRSPRRRDLLDLLGVPHRVVPSGIPESPLPGEVPEETVVRLASEKAESVLKEAPPGALVIGADTVVVLDGEVLGQPRSEWEARGMLRRLQGRSHTVLTGLCLLHPPHSPARGLSRSRVTFHPLSEEEIAWYVATGEPMDKAGAYAAQGLGAAFLASVEGSFHNVVGFPVDLFYRLLPQAGLSLQALRAARR